MSENLVEFEEKVLVVCKSHASDLRSISVSISQLNRRLDKLYFLLLDMDSEDASGDELSEDSMSVDLSQIPPIITEADLVGYHQPRNLKRSRTEPVPFASFGPNHPPVNNPYFAKK